MNEIVEYKVDRTGWKPGPWDAEPDKLNWKTRAGLPGMIVRNRLGGLCGYVAVTKDHPLYGHGYGAIEERINVHGGLTYADSCSGPICHVPEPGEPDDVWWFGFDCVHAGDYYPASSAYEAISLGFAPIPRSPFGRGETYRALAYVRDEVESLAEQLAASYTTSKEGTQTP